MGGDSWKRKEEIITRVLQKYYRNSAIHNLRVLGIERTFEIIESFRNPVYRAKLRQIHLNVLKGGVKC